MGGDIPAQYFFYLDPQISLILRFNSTKTLLPDAVTSNEGIIFSIDTYIITTKGVDA